MTVRRSSTKPLLFIRPIRFNPFNRFTSRYGLRGAIITLSDCRSGKP